MVPERLPILLLHSVGQNACRAAKIELFPRGRIYIYIYIYILFRKNGRLIGYRVTSCRAASISASSVQDHKKRVREGGKDREGVLIG